MITRYTKAIEELTVIAIRDGVVVLNSTRNGEISLRVNDTLSVSHMIKVDDDELDKDLSARVKRWLKGIGFEERSELELIT